MDTEGVRAAMRRLESAFAENPLWVGMAKMLQEEVSPEFEELCRDELARAQAVIDERTASGYEVPSVSTLELGMLWGVTLAKALEVGDPMPINLLGHAPATMVRTFTSQTAGIGGRRLKNVAPGQGETPEHCIALLGTDGESAIAWARFREGSDRDAMLEVMDVLRRAREGVGRSLPEMPED